MVQTSFAERLERIEHAQGQPAATRLLAGISEAALSKNAAKTAKSKAGKRKQGDRPGSGKLVRIAAGFVLIYASALIMSRMTQIQSWLDASAELATYRLPIMSAIAVMIIAVFVFFAFKLQRAAFRVMTEPWRLPFAMGMVMGLAIGFAPPELSHEMLAQLH